MWLKLRIFSISGHALCIYIYWLTKETLQTFFANGSNRNIEKEYLLYSNKWIIATMLFASSIIVVYDWRFMRWRNLLKQHLMPQRLITWPVLMQNVFLAFFYKLWYRKTLNHYTEFCQRVFAAIWKLANNDVFAFCSQVTVRILIGGWFTISKMFVRCAEEAWIIFHELISFLVVLL